VLSEAAELSPTSASGWQELAEARQKATIPAFAVSLSVSVGVRALVDFSLQIQAVTLIYMAILGAGVAQATFRSSPSIP
jgi:hypothetical protein